MLLLIAYLLLALSVSFLCSLLEAVLLSVTPTFAAAFAERSPGTGAVLRRMKADIDRPLAAILTLNTFAHTVGAAGVGAQSLVLFGSSYVAATSAVVTLLILFLTEIIPKTLGAVHWRRLVPATVRVLQAMIFLVYPLVLVSEKLIRTVARGKKTPQLSRDEFRAMAELARQEGLFRENESRILKNLLGLRKLVTRDIMTPRPVVFTLPASMTAAEAAAKHSDLKFTRIPLYESSPEDIRTFVLRNDILLAASRGNPNAPLASLGRPLMVVPELASLAQLFEQFFERRGQAALVVDEHGGVAGIVTMEDLIETLLGLEIVGETDPAVDMQALARQQWRKRARELGLAGDY